MLSSRQLGTIDCRLLCTPAKKSLQKRRSLIAEGIGLILTDVMYVVKRFVVCGYRFEAVATTVPPDQDGGTYPRPAPRLLGPTTKPAPLISRKATLSRRARRRHCFRRRHRCRRCPSPSPRSPLLLPPSSPVLSLRRRCRRSAAAVATVAVVAQGPNHAITSSSHRGRTTITNGRRGRRGS